MAGLISVLPEHHIIGFDTSIFIHQFENVAPNGEVVDTVFEQLAAGRFKALTSIVTLIELIVRPIQIDRPDNASDYDAELLATRI